MILAAKAQSIIAEVKPIIETKYSIILKDPKIEISNRMTRCMGLATSRNVIKLSGVHFTGHENTDAYRGTVIHELCHVAEYQIKKQMSHSPFWKSLMVLCGQKPDRLFEQEQQEEISYQRIERAAKRYTYHCNCSQYNLTKSQHQHILFGTAHYTCRKCGSLVK
jgi:predicted SprT family Zn-dependent metalloprotease